MRQSRSFLVGILLLLTACGTTVNSSADNPNGTLDRGTGGERAVGTVDPAPTVEAAAGASQGAAADRAAAVELALRYVASTDSLMGHSPIGQRAILAELVAPEILDDQVQAITAAADSLGETLGEPATEIVWVEAPLTATVAEPDADGSVVVSVWAVSVLAHPSIGLVEQVWRTVHVTAEQRGERWWVTAVSADAGPTPSANELALPSSVEDFLTVARWAPIVAGGEL